MLICITYEKANLQIVINYIFQLEAWWKIAFNLSGNVYELKYHLQKWKKLAEEEMQKNENDHLMQNST